MMNLLRLLNGRGATAPVARERLQILLAHERGLRGQPDLLELLRAEILAAVSAPCRYRPGQDRDPDGARPPGLDAGSRYRSTERRA